MRTVSRLNNSVPPAVTGFHRPSGVVKARRTSFHFQRCNARSHRVTRHHTKWDRRLSVRLQAASGGRQDSWYGTHEDARMLGIP